MNKNKPIPKFEEFFVDSLTSYPSLYASRSLEDAKFRVMDHYFNVIGSGVVQNLLSFKAKNLTKADIPESYVNGSRLFYAYDPSLIDIQQYKKYGIIRAKEDHELSPEVMTEDQIPPHWLPYALDCRVHNRTHPLFPSKDKGAELYPNFNKDYSLVWRGINEGGYKASFEDFPLCWREAAKDFYTQCFEFFNDLDRCDTYTSAVDTRSERSVEYKVRCYTDVLNRKYEWQNPDTWAAITKAYGGKVQFRGNVQRFAELLWQELRKEIIEFIRETLEHLDKMKPDPSGIMQKR